MNLFLFQVLSFFVNFLLLFYVADKVCYPSAL